MDAQLEAAAALPDSGVAQQAPALMGALKRKSQSSAKVVPLDVAAAASDVETGTAAALTDAKVCGALPGRGCVWEHALRGSGRARMCVCWECVRRAVHLPTPC